MRSLVAFSFKDRSRTLFRPKIHSKHQQHHDPSQSVFSVMYILQSEYFGLCDILKGTTTC